MQDGDLLVELQELRLAFVGGKLCSSGVGLLLMGTPDSSTPVN